MEPYGPVPPPHAANVTTNEALMIRVMRDIRIDLSFAFVWIRPVTTRKLGRIAAEVLNKGGVMF